MVFHGYKPESLFRYRPYHDPYLVVDPIPYQENFWALIISYHIISLEVSDHVYILGKNVKKHVLTGAELEMKVLRHSSSILKEPTWQLIPLKFAIFCLCWLEGFLNSMFCCLFNNRFAAAWGTVQRVVNFSYFNMDVYICWPEFLGITRILRNALKILVSDWKF